MYKFKGKGFVPGIPARDLTDAEARQYGLLRIKASGLWERIYQGTANADVGNGADQADAPGHVVPMRRRNRREQ